MAEVQPPYAFQTGSIQHPAILFRRALAGIVGEGIASFNSGNKRTPDDLKVTENSPAAMSVIVARGGGYVQGDDVSDQGVYFVYNDGNKVVTVPAADASNPRKDIIVARIKDNTHGVAGDTWALELVAGTPSATPSEPALPASALKLATVDVLALATTITNARITDRRARITSDLSAELVGAEIYRNGVQSVADNNPLAIDLPQETLDTNNFHDTAVQPSRITIPNNFGDWYEADGQLEFAVGTGTRQARILVNGAEKAKTRVAAASTGQTALQVHWDGFLNDADYVQLEALQISGGAIDVNGGAIATWLKVRRRGPR